MTSLILVDYVILGFVDFVFSVQFVITLHPNLSISPCPSTSEELCPSTNYKVSPIHCVLLTRSSYESLSPCVSSLNPLSSLSSDCSTVPRKVRVFGPNLRFGRSVGRNIHFASTKNPKMMVVRWCLVFLE